MVTVDKSSCSCAGCLVLMVGFAGYIFLITLLLILAEFPIEYRGTTGTTTGIVTRTSGWMVVSWPISTAIQSCEATVVFTAPEGKVVIFTDNGISSCKYEPDQQVPVTYMLNNPSDAQIPTSDWTAAIIIPVAALVILSLLLLPLIGVLVKVIREMDLPYIISSRFKAQNIQEKS